MFSESATIFALATGRLPSAIAVVRISGPRTGVALASLTGREINARQATLVTVSDGYSAPIDEAIALRFPAPHSATGEDVAELHIHGSRAVLVALTLELQRLGLRLAEPGEFTRRAFENGKLDLTSAEGLDDLVHADTDMQRRQALKQLKGLLGARAEDWRRRIIAASGLIEAGIDFPDEDDVPEDLLAPALLEIKTLFDEIQEVLAAQAQSERLRDGLVVAIAGPPNAGKSTLLNRLARRDAAIVSPHAGTTRDVIEVHLDLNGYPVVLLDTAGLRDSDDPVEQEGMRRARDRAANADLVLWLSENDQAVDRQLESSPVWRVRTKIDKGSRASRPTGEYAISAESGEGVEVLTGAIATFAENYFGSSESALITRTRHRTLLQETCAGLERALAAQDAGSEIVAEELRTSIHSLGRLVGRIDIEDVLDGIFREFCIGK